MGMAAEVGAELSKRACVKSEGPKKKEKTLLGTGNHLEAAEYLENRENSGLTQTDLLALSSANLQSWEISNAPFSGDMRNKRKSTAHLLEQNYSLVSDSEDTAIRCTK